MNQITRCPFCETSFRVVADQLRISDGWVRCGQCKKVFDATEYLQTIEPAPLLPEMPLDKLRPPPAPHRTPQTVRVWGRPSPMPVPPPAPAAAPEPPVPAEAQPPAEQPPAAWDVPPPPVVPAFLAAHAPPPAAEDALPAIADEPADEPADTLQDPVTAAPEEENTAPGDDTPSRPSRHGSSRRSSSSRRRKRAREPSPSISPLTLLSEWSEDPSAEPEFVKAARRGAFWRRPSVRAVLLLVLLALLGALALQVAVQERDTLAARYPALRPALTGLCARLGCALQAPRNISAVVVDSSSFIKTRDDDASTYQLQISIKNTAPTAVAMPAVELTLTDAQNQTLLRKVLLRKDLSAPAELAGGQTWSGSTLLRVSSGATQVAGYSVLAFYP